MSRSCASNPIGAAVAPSWCRRSFLVVVAAAALSGCGAAGPEAASPGGEGGELPADSPARAFVGTYRFAGTAAERESVEKAIDSSVSQIGSFLRGFARKRLLAANRVPTELVMKGGEKSFVILVDNRPYSGLLNGTPVKVNVETGDVMDMSFKFGPEMVQTFADSEKGRVNTFELHGDRMVMHVRVYADQLPQEVKYDLTFTKQEAAHPDAAAAP